MEAVTKNTDVFYQATVVCYMSSAWPAYTRHVCNQFCMTFQKYTKRKNHASHKFNVEILPLSLNYQKINNLNIC